MAEGKGVLQYRFVVAKNGKNIFVRDYNTTNKITWTPAQAGTYTIYFKAKDESGKEVAKSMDYEVSEKSTANKGAIQNSIGINSSDDTGVTVKLSSAGDTSLYSFNDYFYPINDEWSIYGGNWKVENGKLGVNAGGGYKALIKDKAPFTDFVCEADVNVDNGDSDAGIVFRASNPTVGMDSYLGYYVGVYGKRQGLVLGKASYSWKVLGWASTPISTTSSNHIKIEVCGSQIKVYLNDMNIPKIIAYDSSYTSGELGFRTCNADAEFDNLVIKETPNALYSYDQLYQFKKDLFEMQMSDNPIEKGKYIAKYFYDRWFTWWGEKNTENASAMGMPKEYAEIYGDFQSLLLVQGFTQVTVNGVRAYKNIRTGEIVYDSEALKGSSSEGVGKTVFTTTEDAANVLGKELNGTVSQLKNGYKVEIPNGNKPIVVRVMNEGSGGRANPYYRVSIDGKGSLTLDGTLSSDRGLTHIDMTDDYLSQIETMINKYLGK